MSSPNEKLPNAQQEQAKSNYNYSPARVVNEDYQPNPAQRASESADKTEAANKLIPADQQQSDLTIKYTRTIARWTRVVAVVTAAYAFFAGLQWWEIRQNSSQTQEMIEATKRIANTSENTLKVSQRPWVNAESVELMKPLEMPPNSRFSVFLNVIVRNSGTSVATDGYAFIYAEPNSTAILSRDWNKPCETADTQRAAIKANVQYNPWPIGFVLVPGQTTKLPIGAFSDDITPEQARTGSFYVLGCATYKDQFNIMHMTRFCFQPTSAIDDPANVIFTVCNAFQEAN